MKKLNLFLGFCFFLIIANTSCTKNNEVYNYPDNVTLEEIVNYNIDKRTIARYIEMLRDGSSEVMLGNPGGDVNLKALDLILEKFNLDQIETTENNGDQEITPRVANWYWKYTGQHRFYILCWCTQYYCKHRFGSNCSNLGVSWNAEGWKTYSQVQCWQ